MATNEDEEGGNSVGLSKEQYDIITNKIAVAIARHEAVVKGWVANSARSQEPRKTQEQLEAEDAELFRPQPLRLGIGHPIPAHFLKTDAETGNKDLRAKIFPSKTLKASKARDADEKAASTKRGMREQSSDEEEGRSGLGRAKKQKTKVVPETPNKAKEKPALNSRDSKEDTQVDGENMAKVADLAGGKNLEWNQESNKSENGQAAEDGTESQPTEKQKKKKKKKSKSLGVDSEREPQGIPILPSRPVPSSPHKVDKSSDGSTKGEIATSDKMEFDDLVAGSDLAEAERLRRKELKKELKKQRKKERKEKRRSEQLPANSP